MNRCVCLTPPEPLVTTPAGATAFLLPESSAQKSHQAKPCAFD